MTTSAFSPASAILTRKRPASLQKKRILDIWFILALLMASRTASWFNSTPITFPAFLLAIIPIVPIPQYASTTVSFPVSPASSRALYTISPSGPDLPDRTNGKKYGSYSRTAYPQYILFHTAHAPFPPVPCWFPVH